MRLNYLKKRHLEKFYIPRSTLLKSYQQPPENFVESDELQRKSGYITYYPQILMREGQVGANEYNSFKKIT